jgi:hypothetical protein
MTQTFSDTGKIVVSVKGNNFPLKTVLNHTIQFVLIANYATDYEL